ncbi:MAG: restriction endonuclease subunit S [Candidatus Kuenenia sp.]|nr:restriction endonuclease subunit S [Candidatus Kuenenia sp.]
MGRSAIADNRVLKGNVNQHVCIIRVDEDKTEPRFLNYFLFSFLGQKQISNFQAGGNRQGLNFGQIKSIQIPLPPTKAEQNAIAAALNDADALIYPIRKTHCQKAKHQARGNAGTAEAERGVGSEDFT